MTNEDVTPAFLPARSPSLQGGREWRKHQGNDLRRLIWILIDNKGKG